jgi:photosystem II stability/assembly factor-like uncharacterized protein
MKRLVLLLFLFCTIALAHTFHGVSMVPNTLKGWVVASDTGLICYTPDCGLTWINQSFFTSRYFFDVFFLNEQKGWIGTDCGFIFYTDNGGQIWSIQVMGLACLIERFFLLDSNYIWVGCYTAILGRTTDGGQNWEQIMLPYPQFHYDTVDIHGVSFINKYKGWFCSGRYPGEGPCSGDTNYSGGQGFIATSADSGLNWQLLLRDTIYDFFDIKMLDTLNGFVVGGNDRTMSAVVMKTSNGGNAWQPVTIPSQAKYLRSLQFVGNHAWAVGHNGTIIHSNNGGNTWQMQTSNVNTTLYDVDFADTLHGLISGDSYVLYTYNGGNTWNIANVGIEEESSTHNAIHIMLEVYPNPAKTLTAIHYSLPAESKVSLQLYDISGRLVKTLVNEQKKQGNYSINLNSRTLSAGVYFLSLETEEKKIIERVVVIK